MNTSDYILQAALVLVVLRQVRESRLDLMTLLLPVALVGWAAQEYLGAIPSGGNDLWLIATGVTLGAGLGVASGLATHMRAVGSDVLVRAGAVAAGLWIAGMGFRLVFQFGADHGLGHALTSFSMDHAITGADAWTAALVLMAFAQVLTRLAVIRGRAFRLTGTLGLRRAAAA